MRFALLRSFDCCCKRTVPSIIAYTGISDTISKDEETLKRSVLFTPYDLSAVVCAGNEVEEKRDNEGIVMILYFDDYH
jgi:hypothetical protein